MRKHEHLMVQYAKDETAIVYYKDVGGRREVETFY